MHKSHHLRKGRISLNNHFYMITMVTKNRKKIFTTLTLNRLLVTQMMHLERAYTLKSNAFVIMPDHIHWQFQLKGELSLSEIVKRFKGRVAAAFRQQNVYNLWQHDYYDHQIRDERDLINNARYIIANPLRAGLVKSVADYPYWDCVYM